MWSSENDWVLFLFREKIWQQKDSVSFMGHWKLFHKTDVFCRPCVDLSESHFFRLGNNNNVKYVNILTCNVN